ncbi:MAG: leucine-rich repeat domain-containing protein, partial [Promethearchaeota archaeon]
LSLNPLKFMIQNDNSILVLKSFFDFLKNQKNQFSEVLKEELTSKLVKVYNLVMEESEFLLEIESLINKDRKIGFYNPPKSKGHILALDLAGQKINTIPHSVGLLSKLEHLNLWNNNLISLPESIEALSKLKSLYLDWNNFKIIPEIKWERLRSLNKLNLNNNVLLKKIPDSLFKLAKQNFSKKYIKEGVIASEAPVLGLLEFFTGMNLKKSELDDRIYTHYACNYKIDPKGHILGIYLYGYPIFQTCIFPEQICNLKFLRELILRDQNIKQIPEAIGKLESLKNLDLMRNQIKHIPETMRKLDSLEYLDISENKIQKIPEFLKEKSIDLWI